MPHYYTDYNPGSDEQAEDLAAAGVAHNPEARMYVHLDTLAGAAEVADPMADVAVVAGAVSAAERNIADAGVGRQGRIDSGCRRRTGVRTAWLLFGTTHVAAEAGSRLNVAVAGNLGQVT
jgi:hypothetical protein